MLKILLQDRTLYPSLTIWRNRWWAYPIIALHNECFDIQESVFQGWNPVIFPSSLVWSAALQTPQSRADEVRWSPTSCSSASTTRGCETREGRRCWQMRGSATEDRRCQWAVGALRNMEESGRVGWATTWTQGVTQTRSPGAASAELEKMHFLEMQLGSIFLTFREGEKISCWKSHVTIIQGL